jgi:hypothetical protein
MSMEPTGPLQRNSRRMISGEGRINDQPEVWRELIHWFTPNQLLALGHLILSLSLSICILSVVFLEAIGVLEVSRASDILLLGLGYFVTSGLKRTSVSHGARLKD